ncbi:hypothetical protein TEA_025332 [Camellia sinensis var. sinensis]|uniref:T-complex protein 1 subunit theta n=1 Tax=Camellia sinensis var. sinensis TaxID=542762 RepID=A0A4S4D0M2_CAMSN|nr:hypothetical protein TEA_025332 [Camellia sinensis var. sinensis]
MGRQREKIYVGNGDSEEGGGVRGDVIQIWYEQDGYQSLDKLFITNDAATIVNELEVQHPAAKILVLAGKAQQEEIGDGANLTVSFAGELLQNAEELIRMGLHPSEIIIGYTKAINKTIEILDELVAKGSEKMDVRNKDEVIKRMKAAVASKQFGLEDILCPLIAEACIQVCPKNPANFNVDNVRVARLLGGGLHNCTIVRVMVLKNDTVGSINFLRVAVYRLMGPRPSLFQNSLVAVFVGGVDTSATETKGTILIHSAEQLLSLFDAKFSWQSSSCHFGILQLENYAKTEEAKVEELIKAVANSGAKDFKIQNIVGSCDVKFPIRLEGLAYSHGAFSSYEPELFPGLIYRMKQPKIVLLIFVSGKIVLTGAKVRDETYTAFENIYPVLTEFRKNQQWLGLGFPGGDVWPSEWLFTVFEEGMSSMVFECKSLLLSLGLLLKVVLNCEYVKTDMRVIVVVGLTS